MIGHNLPGLEVIGGCGPFWIFLSAVISQTSLHQNRWLKLRWTEGEKYLVLFYRAAIIRSQVFIGLKIKWPLKLRCGFDKANWLIFLFISKTIQHKHNIISNSKKVSPPTARYQYRSVPKFPILFIVSIGFICKSRPCKCFFVFLWRRKQVPRNVQSVFCFWSCGLPKVLC